MVTKDDSAPATKKDLQLLKGELRSEMQELKGEMQNMKGEMQLMKEDTHRVSVAVEKLYAASEEWKDEIIERMERWKDEIINHFHVIAEDLRHDLLGIHTDKISLLADKVNDHEERITVLESRPL